MALTKELVYELYRNHKKSNYGNNPSIILIPLQMFKKFLQEENMSYHQEDRGKAEMFGVRLVITSITDEIEIR